MSPIVRRSLIVLAVAIVALVVLVFTYVAYVDSVHTTRGSLSYFLTITSSRIRNCVTPGIISEPEFVYESGDGPAPVSNEIRFSTRVSAEETLAAIDEYMTGSGAVKTYDGLAWDKRRMLKYDAGSTEIEVFCRDRKRKDVREIVIVERYP